MKNRQPTLWTYSRIILACAVGLLLSTISTYVIPMSVFMKGISVDTGWSRFAVSGCLSASQLAALALAPWFGVLADRVGPKRIVVASTAVMALGLIALGFVPHIYPLFMAVAVLVGVAGLGTTSFLYGVVLSQWFDRRFGLSLGLATIGAGLGASLSPMVSQHLLVAYGWQHAFVLLGFSVLIVAVPCAMLLLQNGPGVHTDTPAPTAANAPAAEVLGMTREESFRTVAFWRILISITLISVIASGTSFHLVSLLTDRGLDISSASKYLGLFGVAAFIGRVIGGILLDHVRACWLGLGSFLAPAVGIALIELGGMNAPSLVAGTLLLGVAYGVEGDLLPFLVRREFGMKAFGAISGTIFASFTAGALAGPLMMAASYDLWKSYGPTLAAFTVMSLVAAYAVAGVGRSAPTSPQSTRLAVGPQ